MWRHEGCTKFPPSLVYPGIGCHPRLKQTGPIFALRPTRAAQDVRTSRRLA